MCNLHSCAAKAFPCSTANPLKVHNTHVGLFKRLILVLSMDVFSWLFQPLNAHHQIILMCCNKGQISEFGQLQLEFVHVKRVNASCNPTYLTFLIFDSIVGSNGDGGSKTSYLTPLTSQNLWIINWNSKVQVEKRMYTKMNMNQRNSSFKFKCKFQSDP